MECLKRFGDWCTGSTKNQPATFKRVNGFTWPPDKAQLLAWFLLFYFLIAIFGCFCISLAPPYSYVFGVIGGLSFLVHIALNIAVMAVNPGEEAAIKRRVTPQGEFDRQKHKHVIENQFCNICQIVVSLKAKHCRRCNKCVTHFDHHCIYLNNCIGSRNYVLFILTIVTACLGAAFIFLMGIIQFIVSFFNNQTFLTREYFNQNSTLCNMNICPDEYKAYPIFGPVSLASWRAYIMITSLLALLVTILIGYLIGYHIYLRVNKMTTYDHTIKLKERSDEKKRKKEEEKSQKLKSATQGTTTNDKLIEKFGDSFYTKEPRDAAPASSNQISIVNSGPVYASLPPLGVYQKTETQQRRGASPLVEETQIEETLNRGSSRKLRKKRSYTNKSFEEDIINSSVYGANDSDYGESAKKTGKFDYYRDHGEYRKRSSGLNPSNLIGLRHMDGSSGHIPCLNDNMVELNGGASSNRSDVPIVRAERLKNDHDDDRADSPPLQVTTDLMYKHKLPPIDSVSRKDNSVKTKKTSKNKIVEINHLLNEMNGDLPSRRRSLSRADDTPREKSRQVMSDYEEDDRVLSTRKQPNGRSSRRESPERHKY